MLGPTQCTHCKWLNICNENHLSNSINKPRVNILIGSFSIFGIILTVEFWKLHWGFFITLLELHTEWENREITKNFYDNEK